MDLYTREKLNMMTDDQKIEVILALQNQISMLNSNVEKLIEQIRIANSHAFGRKSEKLNYIYEGQLSIFDEAETACNTAAEEPEYEEVVQRRKKRKGKREEDLKDIPEEIIPTHSVSEEALNNFYGKGNYKRMPDETFKRLRYTPASWAVEVHTVEVYVGTDGDHQDEFLRGERPKSLIPNSIVTPSLGAALVNGKYVNAMPLNRIEQQFERDGVNISRQTMSNWMVYFGEHYLHHLYDRMKEMLLKYHVNQCDETPVQVLKDKSPDTDNDTGYMWVHRSGEFYKDKPIVLYEYNKSRAHNVPLEFYKGYKGVLVTDGLEQYHLIAKKLDGLTSANCWAHARRDFSDALKAIGKSNQEAVRSSVAYEALVRISAIYKLEGELKELTPQERFRKRQITIKPLVEDFFEWCKKVQSSLLAKNKTGEGINYCISKEKYLKVFLSDGEVPIDNSASERAIRPFCVGKKNWMFFNTPKGAKASAIIYSITETAKINGLNPYWYVNHLLTELPELIKDNGNIEDMSKLDALLPWSKDLPEICFKQRRS